MEQYIQLWLGYCTDDLIHSDKSLISSFSYYAPDLIMNDCEDGILEIPRSQISSKCSVAFSSPITDLHDEYSNPARMRSLGLLKI